MSDSTKDRTDETDEQVQKKPGEEDTETVAGFPKEAPESEEGENQSKQDE